MQTLLRVQLHLWHCSGSQSLVQGWGISWTELTRAFHVPSLQRPVRHRGVAASAAGHTPCLLQRATALEKPWKSPPFPASMAPKRAVSGSTWFCGP